MGTTHNPESHAIDNGGRIMAAYIINNIKDNSRTMIAF